METALGKLAARSEAAYMDVAIPRHQPTVNILKQHARGIVVANPAECLSLEDNGI